MNLTYKQPGPGDIGWLISAHGFQYSRQYNFDAGFELDIARKVVSFLESKHEFNRILIAGVAGKRVGSIAVSRVSEDTAFINFLLVEEQFRGRGIGGKLMEKVISYAGRSGMKFIRLETYSCLRDARKLYGKWGFILAEKNLSVQMYGQVFDREFWEKEL